MDPDYGLWAQSVQTDIGPTPIQVSQRLGWNSRISVGIGPYPKQGQEQL